MNIERLNNRLNKRDDKPFNGKRVYRALPIILIALIIIGGIMTTGCEKTTSLEKNQKELAKIAPTDLSGYDSMSDYDGEIMLRDVTVRDVADFMDRRESFVLFTGYANCEWCNALMPTLNRIAAENKVLIAYIDTRRNPEWASNMDIDDYDDFVDLFGEWLEEDSAGKLHLYVPMLFFVEKGSPVMVHSGVTPSMEDASEPMTEEQAEELEKTLIEKFTRITDGV